MSIILEPGTCPDCDAMWLGSVDTIVQRVYPQHVVADHPADGEYTWGEYDHEMGSAQYEDEAANEDRILFICRNGHQHYINTEDVEDTKPVLVRIPDSIAFDPKHIAPYPR